MKKLVKFIFESDVISCGVKTSNNFLQTVDIINGSVLRAAFANDILADCPYADEPFNGKNFQAAYRGSQCDDCEHALICKKFSDMSFSFLIPENSMAAPFTAKACKTCGTAHPIMDTLMENGILECKNCKGRMENLKGIIDRKNFSSIKVPHNTSTHTAIDMNTRTAADGSLFSIEAIKKGCVYECEIDDLDSGMLYVDKIIYIGKYSSNGYGKIRIISIEDVTQYNVRQAVEEFNQRFECKGNRRYASILFLSDAKLNIDKLEGRPKTTQEYKRHWKERLFGINAPVEVEQVYAQNFLYNGYVTYGKMNTTVQEMLTEKGSCVKISFDAKDDTVIDFLENLSKNGIGKDTNIGYGKIQVCGNIHMLGIRRNSDE